MGKSEDDKDYGNWEISLLCNKCNNELDLPYGGRLSRYTCPVCEKEYKLNVCENSYAFAESSSCEYYRYGNGDEIEVRSFSNYPVDLLEEAWQDSNGINENEKRPHILLPIVKAYHDAVKNHGRRLLELHSGNLNSQDIELIKKDNIKGTSLNIKNIFKYLKLAYPNEASKIDSFYSTNKSLIKRVWWVRNKMEHFLYSQWSLNSNVFEDRNKNPNDIAPAPDNLNRDFIKRVNHLSVDIYKLIIDLRPVPKDSWQYNSIEMFRLE
ncbi:MAG: hypothetical protein ABSE89_01235 [Sedimentisphaerales bacterium]